MGIHQFKLEVVPKAFLGNPMVEVVPEDQLQEGLYPWINVEPPSEAFLNALRALLPIDKAWGEVEEFASSDGFASKLRIWWEAGHLDNIDFAYSPVADPWSILQRFLSIVSAEGLLLVERDTGRVLEPTEQALKPIFLESRAARFMANPQETILRSAADLKARRENA
jgi:hypothetical protein